MEEKYRPTNGRRQFDDRVENDDEMDDFTFLKHPKQGSSGYIFSESTESGSAEGMRRRQIMDETERVNQRTLDVSKRTLGMVHESEQIGIETAQELLHQREQLENCDAKVGEINRNLRTSQKHINSIKSIFGGFMNRFSKSSETTSAAVAKPPDVEKTPTALALTLENVKTQNPPQYKSEHPALKLRGVDYSPESPGAKGNLFDDTKFKGARVEEQLNENLEDLGLGLSRLKGLAMGLGQEIEEQNAMLDRLNTPIDKAELAIQRQNKEMKKILHK